MKNKTKYIVLGMGVVALGTGAYFFHQHQKKKKRSDASQFKSALELENMELPPPADSGSSNSYTSSSTPAVQSGFPLKKGSKGTLVKNLQNALIKKYGSQVLPRYGADGHFGSETLRALQSNGLPGIVTSEVFTQLLMQTGGGNTTATTPPTTAASKASELHRAIAQKDFSTALRIVQSLKDVAEYSAVNTIFKKTRIDFVRKTLLTAVLQRFSSPTQKKSFNNAFYRIGLKFDGTKWSLSGFADFMVDQLVTHTATKIWDKTGEYVNVPEGTILGEYLTANNGVTEFETVDGKTLFAKTADLHYRS